MHSPCTHVQSELRLDRIGHVLSRPILPSPLTRFLILVLRTIFSLTCFPHMLFNQADRWSPVNTPPSTTIYEWALKKKKISQLRTTPRSMHSMLWLKSVGKTCRPGSTTCRPGSITTHTKFSMLLYILNLVSHESLYVLLTDPSTHSIPGPHSNHQVTMPNDSLVGTSRRVLTRWYHQLHVLRPLF